MAERAPARGAPVMGRLYWRIYAGFLLILLIFTLMVGTLRLLSSGDRDREGLVEAVAATAADLLPPRSASSDELEATLTRLAQRFRADATVYAPDGELLATAGAPVPSPPDDGDSGWVHEGGRHGFALLLPDGRWLVAHKSQPGGPWERRWLWALVLLAAAIALGSYPLARRLTRRLEHLQRQVEALGAGDLSARVTVDGRDEVAQLAGAFNAAAQRVESLVAAQRGTLAGASHELRSPLARIRMALELAGDGLRPDLRERMEHDIGELDDLIQELLLASRLQAGAAPERHESVDLLALLAEECSRVGAQAGGDPARLEGDPRLLQRMLRNLLENAVRHGGGTPVEAALRRDGERIVITVADRGPGIPEDYRDRIFEPFFRPPGMREGEDRGVGLGLALVREIARHHGGDVRCDSREGGGTLLTVEIRAHHGATAASS